MIDFKTLQVFTQHAALLRELMQPGFLEKFEKQVTTLSAAEKARQDAATKLIADSLAAQETAKKAHADLDQREKEISSAKSEAEKMAESQRAEKARLIALKGQLDKDSAALDVREGKLADDTASIQTQHDSIKAMLVDIEKREKALIEAHASLTKQQTEADNYARQLKEAGAAIKEKTSGL